MRYRVEVVTGSGTTDQREVEARTSREAEEQVRQRGLYPLRVIEALEKRSLLAVGAAKLPEFLDRIFRVSALERLYFTQKLATFLKAGLPILPAIEILRDQTRHGPMKSRLNSVAQDIAAGEQLGSSLEKFPKDFSKFYVAAVRAGEAGGHLSEILEQLGTYLEQLRQRKRKAITAVIYPVFLLAMVIGVLFFVATKFVPLVESFMKSLRINLPPLTAKVLAVHHAFIDHFFLILFIPILLILIYSFILLRLPWTRRAIHRFWLWMPVTGWLIRGNSFSWFFRTFAMLSYSGVPALHALKVSAGIIRNDIIREEVERIRDEVARGESISKTMEKGGLFNRFSVTMVDVGERSGEIDTMMNRVADFYDQELNEFYARAERIGPAIIIVVMSVLVGTIIVALYLPILTIIEALAD